MCSVRESLPHLPCNAGGADVRAPIYEEKGTVVLHCSLLVQLLLHSKSFSQDFPIQKHFVITFIIFKVVALLYYLLLI